MDVYRQKTAKPSHGLGFVALTLASYARRLSFGAVPLCLLRLGVSFSSTVGHVARVCCLELSRRAGAISTRTELEVALGGGRSGLATLFIGLLLALLRALRQARVLTRGGGAQQRQDLLGVHARLHLTAGESRGLRFPDACTRALREGT